MTRAMLIALAPASVLPARAEADVLRKALARSPNSSTLRLRLANFLYDLDEFDDAIALLAAAMRLQLGERHVLAAAYFARHAPDDAGRAYDVMRDGMDLAQTARERSRVLAQQAKALLRQDRPTEALDLLDEALRLDCCNVMAFKRLAIQRLRMGDAAAVIALTDALEQQGVRHSRLFAARSMAHAMLGDAAQARAVTGIEALLYQRLLDPPPGWDSLTDFNAALVGELLDNPAMRYERHGTASLATWRIDALATADTPAINSLLAAIAAAAVAHVAALSGSDHPWLAASPDHAIMRSWCVITGGAGHEQWHMHPDGWLSGGYYPQVPAPTEAGNDSAGCLEFGLPDGLIGASAAEAFGTRLVRPQAGLLTLFPSHAYHRTFPHGADGQRFCIAFDICPA